MMLRTLSFISIYISTVLSRTREIRMQRDFTSCPTYEPFNVYWNVPTFMCAKHGINFSPYTEKWGIESNNGDQFRGDVVNILYDPGLFPAMLQSSKTKRLVARNGGIPQAGNITKHLDAFQATVIQLLPKDFKGPAIIDFEAYRPIWRQNWGKQTIYQNMSKDEVRQSHPQWPENDVTKAAASNFEAASKIFFKYTIDLAKLLRPKAMWGYYGYPYCYNYRENSGMLPACEESVQEENNKIQWLFDGSGALYPSIYMTERLKDTLDQRRFVLGRLNEGVRTACRSRSRPVPKVFPYLWYKYYDSVQFLSSGDLYQAIETVRKYKMGGLVIWGATNDVTSKDKCSELLDYLNNTLGPTLRLIRSKASKSEENNPAPEFLNFIRPNYEGSPIHLKGVEPNDTNKLSINLLSDKPDHSNLISTESPKKKSKKCPPNKKCRAKEKIPRTPLLNAYINWYDRIARAILNMA